MKSERIWHRLVEFGTPDGQPDVNDQTGHYKTVLAVTIHMVGGEKLEVVGKESLADDGVLTVYTRNMELVEISTAHVSHVSVPLKK